MSRNRMFLPALVMAVIGLLSVTDAASAANRPAGTVWSYGQIGFAYPAYGAKVTATNVANKKKTYSVTANWKGEYLFGTLPSGTYRITASYINPRTGRTETGTCFQAVLDGRPPYIVDGFNIITR